MCKLYDGNQPALFLLLSLTVCILLTAFFSLFAAQYLNGGLVSSIFHDTAQPSVFVSSNNVADDETFVRSAFDQSNALILGLLDYNRLNEKYFSQNGEVDFTKTPAFVTATSSNHYLETVPLIETFSRIWTGKKLYFYDLGLTDDEALKLKRIPFIIYRKFNFTRFPPYVANLYEYRFKPIILAEMLLDHQGVFWCDASVRFKCPVTTTAEKPYVLLTPTADPIYTTTHPGMYKYFRGDMEKFASVPMWQAGVQLIYATPFIRRQILQPLLWCALEENCMGPKGSNLFCTFNKDMYYANCNRYDQSAVNMLLAIAYGYNISRYTENRYDCLVISAQTYPDDEILDTLAI